MKNQIKVDKNRKGILFFLDIGPLICAAADFGKTFTHARAQAVRVEPRVIPRLLWFC